MKKLVELFENYWIVLTEDIEREKERKEKIKELNQKIENLKKEFITTLDEWRVDDKIYSKIIKIEGDKKIIEINVFYTVILPSGIKESVMSTKEKIVEELNEKEIEKYSKIREEIDKLQEEIEKLKRSDYLSDKIFKDILETMKTDNGEHVITLLEIYRSLRKNYEFSHFLHLDNDKFIDEIYKLWEKEKIEREKERIEREKEKENVNNQEIKFLQEVFQKYQKELKLIEPKLYENIKSSIESKSIYPFLIDNVKKFLYVMNKVEKYKNSDDDVIVFSIVQEKTKNVIFSVRKRNLYNGKIDIPRNIAPHFIGKQGKNIKILSIIVGKRIEVNVIQEIPLPKKFLVKFLSE
ncbi:MAG: hypothetical protein QW607_10635 [Desulfurococcaceae archaeon]